MSESTQRRSTQCGSRAGTWLARAFAIVAPPRCAICAEHCDPIRIVCDRCSHALRVAPLGIDGSGGYGGLDHVFAAYDYAGVARDAIRSLKYAGRTALAAPIARWVALRLPPLLLKEPLALVPVPAHPANKRQRGFNQSLLIAQELGKLIGAPVWDCLSRDGQRPPQSQLNRAQRLLISKAEFTVEPRRFRHQDPSSLADFPTNVVVCDDVTTTTCTLEACASAIRERHSVQSIHGLAFASVSPKDNSAGHGTTDRIA